jgi:hypothetical protein
MLVGPAELEMASRVDSTVAVPRARAMAIKDPGAEQQTFEFRET